MLFLAALPLHDINIQDLIAVSQRCKVHVCLPQVIHQFYVDFTGQSLEKIQEETDRDNFMSPQQAMDMGLIDGVIR